MACRRTPGRADLCVCPATGCHPVVAPERPLGRAAHDLLRQFLEGGVDATRVDALDHRDRRTVALLAGEVSIRTTGPAGAFWFSATVGFLAKPASPRSTREGSRRWEAWHRVRFRGVFHRRGAIRREPCTADRRWRRTWSFRWALPRHLVMTR